MKYISTVLLYFLATLPLAAQSERKFGDITIADFSRPATLADTAAGAVVLYEKGHTYFKYEKNIGFRMYFVTHRRILILQQHGFDWANVEEITLREGNSIEDFTLRQAQTYNIVNGAITREKVGPRQVFVQDMDENRRLHKFTFPAVKQGSIIEYEIEVQSPFMLETRPWRFQDHIPVLWSEYVVEYPACFTYTAKKYGLDTLFKYEQEEGEDTVYIRYDVKMTDQGRDQTFTDRVYVFRKLKHRMVMKDQPPFIAEPYVSAISNYLNRAEFELEATDMPWATHKEFSETWETLNKNLLTFPWFGGELENTKLVKRQVQEILQGAADDHEKARRLLSYLQRELTWNKEKGIRVTTALDHVMERRKGNVADLNMMLVLMMKSAGMNACPLVLSTRDNGYIHESDPSLTQLNYVIAAYRVDSVWHFADATDKYTVIDLLPDRCLNSKGRLIHPAESNWVSLLPAESDKEKNVLDLTLTADGKLKGTFTRNREGHLALSLRNQLALLANQEAYVEKHIMNSFRVNVTNFAFKYLDTPEQPTEETYEVNVAAKGSASGKYLQFDPFVIRHFSQVPFRAPARTFPVEFPYRVEERYQVNITLPEGFKLKDIPQNADYNLSEQGIQYMCLYTVQGNTLKIRTRLVMNALYIPREQYAALRDLFEKIAQQQAQQLTVVKE